MKWSLAAVLLVGAAVLLVGGSVHLHRQKTFGRPNVIALSARLQPLFEKTKTVCFGRFLVDVPATADVIYGPAQVPIEFERYPNQAHRIDEQVIDRLGKIEGERKHIGLTARETIGSKDSLYGKVMDGAMPGQKLVFGHSQGIFYRIESYLPIGKDLFVLDGEAFPEKVHEKIALVNMVARNLRARAEDEIPTEPGVCVDGGFFPNIEHDFENVTVGIRLKEFPDVHFSIWTIKQEFQRDSTMAQDIKDAERSAWESGHGLWYQRIRVFRQGPRQLGDWPGYEALVRLPPAEGSGEAHSFQFESAGVAKDTFKPAFDIKLDTGAGDKKARTTPPSLTDEEAVALWDKLLGTIRVRPTGDAAKRSEAAPPNAPLGTELVTGRTCQQTGWWSCIDDGAVPEDKRRHLREGERMPRAAIAGKLTAWQKLKGEDPISHMAPCGSSLSTASRPPRCRRPRRPAQKSRPRR